MTNGLKFVTAQERYDAFLAWCRNHGANCQKKPDFGAMNCASCQFAWLDLEAEEEKPETIEDIVDEMRRHTRVSAADAFYGVTEWTKLCERIIAAHNRVAKAVKEEKR